MHPYTTDTSCDAAEVQASLVRAMPANERANKAIRMSTRLARECKQAIRRNNPTYSEEQVRIGFIELNYGKCLAREVEQYLEDAKRAP